MRAKPAAFTANVRQFNVVRASMRHCPARFTSKRELCAGQHSFAALIRRRVRTVCSTRTWRCILLTFESGYIDIYSLPEHRTRLRRDRLIVFGYGNYGTWSFAPACTATAAGPADALTGRQPVLTAHIRISIMRLNPIAKQCGLHAYAPRPCACAPRPAVCAAHTQSIALF